MGQEELIVFLKKQDKPLSRTQIAEAMKEDEIKISHTLKRLLKYKEVKCFELDRYESAEYLKWKKPLRRVRFYYIN